MVLLGFEKMAELVGMRNFLRREWSWIKFNLSANGK